MQRDEVFKRVMETETIQKNGASLKSRMSRENITQKLFLFFAVLCVGMTSIVFYSCDENLMRTEISLNRTSLTLSIGESETLIASVTPIDAEVTWTSSNYSKVTVDANGIVTAIAAGEATIIAEAGGKTASCRITVKNEPISVTSISLDKTNLTLSKGASYILTATIKPDNATNKIIIWTSSDISKVKVNVDGEVTAMEAGEATITAEVDGKTATCIVLVPPIILNTTELELILGEEQLLCAVTIPTGQSVTWSSSDASKATINVIDTIIYPNINGTYYTSLTVCKVIAKAIGTVNINAKYSGQTIFCTITIYNPSESGVTINGVTWATRNVDAPGTFAAKASDFGMFYQWNRNIGWSSRNPLTSSPIGHSWDNNVPTGTTWETANDPSPVGWRVPTYEELNKLKNVSYTKTTVDGKIGLKLGNGNNSIFLPGSSYRSLSQGNLAIWSSGEVSTVGAYWSSTECGNTNAYKLAINPGFNPVSVLLNAYSRTDACNIRCVKK